MRRFLSCLSLALAVLATAAVPATSRPGAGNERPRAAKAAKVTKPVLPRNAAPHWSSIAPDLDRLPAPGSPRSILVPRGGRLDVVQVPAAPSWPAASRSTCEIVVKRPGGNPTQDMTGSIGHAKSHQSNGGPARMRVCANGY
ncbi:hypothetical protein MMB17_10645 [Methylobacterium organophilum]|uniref:hypothetical protein n=1 Tax=Methylobacterium organophilum TaxID=410 RepID=UPI001F139222|nr:hypothetical protein [Methylobacterium organophilum]UMY19720.1 hypothetical protein MMB17_10645 [Methylobacterium organophilum]